MDLPLGGSRLHTDGGGHVHQLMHEEGYHLQEEGPHLQGGQGQLREVGGQGQPQEEGQGHPIEEGQGHPRGGGPLTEGGPRHQFIPGAMEKEGGPRQEPEVQEGDLDQENGEGHAQPIEEGLGLQKGGEVDQRVGGHDQNLKGDQGQDHGI